MKAVILAGGYGTRLSEETEIKPKPMVTIGQMPMLWHIMKIYSYHGVNDFIICCGYKGYIIKEYFANYFLHMSDVTFHMKDNAMQIHNNHAEPWRVTLIDTGEGTLTGGRLKRVYDFIKNEKSFCFTYGDGLSDVNIEEQINFHNKHGKLATLTATRPPGRYGAIELHKDELLIKSFKEKPEGDNSWINGGFFILKPEALKYIDGDTTSWEAEPLSTLCKLNELVAYKHKGFWQPMDTLREKNLLNNLWESGTAPWKKWD